MGELCQSENTKYDERLLDGNVKINILNSDERKMI